MPFSISMFTCLSPLDSLAILAEMVHDGCLPYPERTRRLSAELGLYGKACQMAMAYVFAVIQGALPPAAQGGPHFVNHSYFKTFRRMLAMGNF